MNCMYCGSDDHNSRAWSDSKKKLPENRFVIRPKNADPNDEAAVNELAGDVAHWIVAQRDRIQKRNAEEKARREKALKDG